MDFEQFDLFSALGLENPAEQEKKEEKKEKKAKEKKASKSAPTSYKLPVKVVIPMVEPIDAVSIEGKESATAEEIRKYLVDTYSWCVNLMDKPYVAKKDGALVFAYKSNTATAVGKGTFQGDIVFRYGENTIPVQTDETAEDGSLVYSTQALYDAFVAAEENLSAVKDISFAKKDNCVVPVFGGDDFKNAIKQEAVTVIYPGVGEYIVKPSEPSKEITPDDVWACESLSGLKEYYDLKVSKSKKFSVVILVPKTTEYVTPKAKEKTFSLDGDVTLSLGFTKLTINSSFFDGKDEVSAEDICKYLCKNGYPEYDVKRTSVEEINKGMLIAILKSSTKGAI